MAVEFLGILERIVDFALKILAENSSFDQKSICLILLGIVFYNISNKSDLLGKVKIYLESSFEYCAIVSNNDD